MDHEQLRTMLDAIVDTISDAILVLEPGGDVRFANSAASALTGIPSDQLVGLKTADLALRALLPDGTAALAEDGPLRDALTKGEDVRNLKLVTDPGDGTRNAYLCNARRVVLDGTPMFVVSVRDLSDAAGYEDQLRHRALHDPFTGLPNRLLLVELVSYALERSRHVPTSVAVVTIDLDDLKVVNDSLGYTAGDAVLMMVASRLRESCTFGETLARVGGDEFVLACEEVHGEADAIGIVERIRKALAQPIKLGQREVTLSASLGVALSSDGQVDADALLRDAAAAMHRAKKRGRDEVEFFGEGIRARVVSDLDVKAQLPLAIERDELEVLYQPKVRLADGTVAGREALIRWNHPQRGTLGAGEFIPLAEQMGMIAPLGLWVLRRACVDAIAWPGASVSVNVSARQLMLDEIQHIVAAALEDAGLAPDRLILEITETALMIDEDRSLLALRSLKDLGVRLAIDDFGKGYSSLSYVRRFPPIDMLKIDGSFVEDMGRDEGDATIVRAIVSLAHGLGAQALAESVELPEQAEHLRAIGCDLGQGYYFGEPVPARAIT